MLHIIMGGLQYHYHFPLLHCHLIQMPKLIALLHHPSLHMQVKVLKSLCLNQILIKGKKWPIPLTLPKNYVELVSSHLHLKDNFSHVIIKIHPQGSNQPKATTKGKIEER